MGAARSHLELLVPAPCKLPHWQVGALTGPGPATPVGLGKAGQGEPAVVAPPAMRSGDSEPVYDGQFLVKVGRACLLLRAYSTRCVTRARSALLSLRILLVQESIPAPQLLSKSLCKRYTSGMRGALQVCARSSFVGEAFSSG
jgi:hypothetical protein